MLCFPKLQLEMGVEVEKLSPGDGNGTPQPGDRIKCHYTGTLVRLQVDHYADMSSETMASYI